MNFSQENDHDTILVKICVMAILTVALIRLPEAIGSSLMIFAGLANRMLSNSGITPPSLGPPFINLASFLVLILVALWVSKYPPFIRKLLSNSKPAKVEPKDESDW